MRRLAALGLLALNCMCFRYRIDFIIPNGFRSLDRHFLVLHLTLRTNGATTASIIDNLLDWNRIAARIHLTGTTLVSC